MKQRAHSDAGITCFSLVFSEFEQLKISILLLLIFNSASDVYNGGFSEHKYSIYSIEKFKNSSNHVLFFLKWHITDD